MRAQPLTDFEVLVEQGADFRCFICSKDEPPWRWRRRYSKDEPPLFRARLQEWPSRPYPFAERERYAIRRRLICRDCFDAFVYIEEPMVRRRRGCLEYAWAELEGRTWGLRHPSGDRGTGR